MSQSILFTYLPRRYILTFSISNVCSVSKQRIALLLGMVSDLAGNCVWFWIQHIDRLKLRLSNSWVFVLEIVRGWPETNNHTSDSSNDCQVEHQILLVQTVEFEVWWHHFHWRWIPFIGDTALVRNSWSSSWTYCPCHNSAIPNGNCDVLGISSDHSSYNICSEHRCSMLENKLVVFRIPDTSFALYLWWADQGFSDVRWINGHLCFLFSVYHLAWFLSWLVDLNLWVELHLSDD